jgi:hypothetical protein
LTANILREKSSGGNSVTLNAESSVLNKKKNGFTVWKGSSDYSDFLSVILETVSNYATPGKVTLVENAIVTKKEIKKIKLLSNFLITVIRNVTIYYLLKKRFLTFILIL